MKTLTIIITALLIFSCESIESKKSKLQSRITNSENLNDSEKKLLEVLLKPCKTDKCIDSVKEMYTELSVDNAVKKTLSDSEERVQNKNQGWEYSSKFDKMKDDTTYYATIRSTNYVNLDFPYKGNNYAYITLRKSKNNSDVLLQVQKGQFNTDHRGTFFYFKFDDNERTLYKLIEPESRETTILFVDKVKDFNNEIKEAKELLVEAKFYNQGNFVFEFNVEDLEW